MKKIIVSLFTLIMLANLVSCTAETSENASTESSEAIVFNFEADDKTTSSEYEIDLSNGDPDVDMDLTQLNSVLLFAQLANMKASPEDYLGITVKISGLCEVYYDSNTEKDYYSAVTYDSTACCSTGLEFVMMDGYDYPEKGGNITVIGVLDKYEDQFYGESYHLIDAVIE
ncbi:MAG: hypothetical protein R3Y33_07140 [Clostridia bacterium]